MAIFKGEKFFYELPADFCDSINNFWQNHQREIHSDYPSLPTLLEHQLS
jgi:hypothetical protein